MLTDRELLALETERRLATLEAEVKDLKRQLAAKDSLLWKIIMAAIAAVGSYGAVLSAEMLRKGGG